MLSGAAGGYRHLVMEVNGTTVQLERLKAKGHLRGIELADNQFHTLVVLEPHSVMFQLKQGPYQHTEDKNFLHSSPTEGCEEARLQVTRWRECFD